MVTTINQIASSSVMVLPWRIWSDVGTLRIAKNLVRSTPYSRPWNRILTESPLSPVSSTTSPVENSRDSYGPNVAPTNGAKITDRFVFIFVVLSDQILLSIFGVIASKTRLYSRYYVAEADDLALNCRFVGNLFVPRDGKKRKSIVIRSANTLARS